MTDKNCGCDNTQTPDTSDRYTVYELDEQTSYTVLLLAKLSEFFHAFQIHEKRGTLKPEDHKLREKIVENSRKLLGKAFPTEKKIIQPLSDHNLIAFIFGRYKDLKENVLGRNHYTQVEYLDSRTISERPTVWGNPINNNKTLVLYCPNSPDGNHFKPRDAVQITDENTRRGLDLCLYGPWMLSVPVFHGMPDEEDIQNSNENKAKPSKKNSKPTTRKPV